MPSTVSYHPLNLAVQAHPQRVALLDRDENSAPVSFDYAQLAAQTAHMAGQLVAVGLRAGDRVAVLLDRSRTAVTLVHALGWLGAVLVPINTRLTAEEMRWQIEKAACQQVLTTLENAPLTEAIPLQALPSSAATIPPAACPPEAPFGILFTSGTSGRPKGALLTWGNLLASAVASAFRLGTLPSDRWLLTLPLYHIGGLSILMRSALYGSAICLPNFPNDHFDLQVIWQRLHEDHVTLVSLVPTMLYRLLKAHPEGSAWPATLRVILLGGAAAPPEMLRDALAAGLPVAVTYGLSEAASQVATATPGETRRKPGTVGKPLMGTRVRVVDEANRDLPPNAIGEIWISGPNVMPGYDADPAANRRALVDGWLRSGDLGYRDPDGDLWIVQRRSDLIISGGENVYPAEVEAVLRQHPSVAEACVVGLPHPEWGQQVAAAVVLNPGETVSPAGLSVFCRDHLGGHKIPRVWRVLPKLPLTASGKIQRAKVRDLLLQISSEM